MIQRERYLNTVKYKAVDRIPPDVPLENNMYFRNFMIK